MTSDDASYEKWLEDWDAEGEARRARLWPNEAQLRAVADRAAKEAGHDLVLRGPFRWGSPGAPIIRVYFGPPLPPTECLAFYVGVRRMFRGLESSTVVLIDERGPEAFYIGSAHDEG